MHRVVTGWCALLWGGLTGQPSWLLEIQHWSSFGPLEGLLLYLCLSLHLWLTLLLSEGQERKAGPGLLGQ